MARLVLDNARAAGTNEPATRLRYGIPDHTPEDPAAAVAAQVRAMAPATDPQGWLTAVAHHLTHPPAQEHR
ncbi:MAG: hypothetical protein ACYC1Z_03480 [Georgenia sp.]